MPSVRPSLVRLLAAFVLTLTACDPSAVDSSEDSAALQPASQASPLAASSWAPTGTMTQIRYFHTATLLPTGKVLVVGGSSGSAVLATAELYDPATGTWTATGSLAQGRNYHTATLLPNGKVLVAGGNGTTAPLSSAELYDPATGTWSTARALARTRNRHTATLLPTGKVLVTGGSGSTGALTQSELYDPATDTWSPTGALTQGRYFHTATLLPNGKVLVAGGYGTGALTSAELYDAATGTWSATGALARDRNRHTATLLPDGRVLVAAGSSLQGALIECELYDPATGTWSATGSVSQRRDSHTATLLPNGKVLMAGGVATSTYYATTELYDPNTGLWTVTGALNQGRSLHVGVLLPSGKVLVAGGESTQYLATAELYEAEPGAWASTGSLNQTRERHTATLLADGRVLLAGGWSPSGSFNTAEVYDAATGTSSTTGSLAQRRASHTATLLLNGKVLATGGEHGGTALATTEVYDAVTSTWTATGSLAQARTGHTATLLPNGKVLVAGGNNTAAVPQAELYDPFTGTWSPAGELTLARSGHTATLLFNGKVLLVGGEGPTGVLLTAELYDPATNTWSATGDTAQARAGHTATLLPNGKVLVVAGALPNNTLNTAELYDPATGTWSATGALSQGCGGHTATLLPGGKVVVTGGSGLASTEVYDPATGTWSTTGALSQARSGHTATLLPNGKVLAAGGYLNTTTLASAALYEDVVAPAAWRPELLSLTPSAALDPGSVFTVNGTRLRGLSEGSNGTTNSAATDFPLLTLMDVARGQRFAVRLQGFSSTQATGVVPAVPAGRYLLTVTVNALTSSLPFQVTDPAAPDTTIVTRPPSPTGQTSATFTFSATAEATFECSLDGAPFTACPSPVTFSNLTEGSHTLRVRAKDLEDDVDPTPALYTWTLDLTGADTSITFKPANPTSQTRSIFSFTSPEQGATFECSLDGEAFSACTAPRIYPSLPEGEHTFQVRARDALGNVDATPASYTWTIDLTPPDTTITSAPGDFTSQTSVTFAFTSNEAGGTFECALDGSPFGVCTSPATYENLTEGQHDFQVRARDALGFADPTPANHSWIISLTNVETTLDSRPPNPSNQRGATFTFSSGANATFDCSLDSAPFTVCTSPATYQNLPDGTHTFQVRARDANGNVDTTPESYTWTLDATAPETTLTQAPPATTRESSATFAFTSNEVGATFECSLDGAAYSPCDASFTYDNLAEGNHTFRVRARDAAGNVDATPAGHSWTVDLTAPDTTLTSTPSNPSNQGGALFTFTSNEAGATFECSLDGAAFSACTTPTTSSNLAEGSHTFQVRARDVAGNVDATPASHTWTVDTTAPDTTLTSTPSNPSNQRGATFTFSASEAGATFECSLDGTALRTCTSPATYDNLVEGPHTFQVHARDAAGNVDATPASHTWTIDSMPPAAPVITSPTQGATLEDNTPTVSGTAQPGSTVTVLLDGVEAGTVTADAAGAWSFTPASALTDGEHTVSATARDGGGTSAASTPVRFTLDTTPEPTDPGPPAAPSGGCGCGAGPGDASWLVAGLALLAGAVSRRRRLTPEQPLPAKYLPPVPR